MLRQEYSLLFFFPFLNFSLQHENNFSEVILLPCYMLSSSIIHYFYVMLGWTSYQKTEQKNLIFKLRFRLRQLMLFIIYFLPRSWLYSSSKDTDWDSSVSRNYVIPNLVIHERKIWHLWEWAHVPYSEILTAKS